MGEAQFLSVSGPDQHGGGRLPTPVGAVAVRRRQTRSVATFVTIVALMSIGTATAPPASAQDDQPKVEAPKPAPPALQDELKKDAPAAPEIQKQDPAPDQKQKDAPTAPGENSKPAPSAPGDTPSNPAPAPPAAMD